jgi:hypothetical protein
MSNNLKQTFQIEYSPKRKTIGFGVEKANVDSPHSRFFFVNYSHGGTFR